MREDPTCNWVRRFEERSLQALKAENAFEEAEYTLFWKRKGNLTGWHPAEPSEWNWGKHLFNVRNALRGRKPQTRSLRKGIEFA